jgi:hypothetical protein
MNGNPGSVAPAPSRVNGPEDAPPDWDQVDWGQAERNKRLVRRSGPEAGHWHASPAGCSERGAHLTEPAEVSADLIARGDGDHRP